ncbi:MAG: polysaccharide pyruvyl transferase family protein [Ruminococcus sp.]|nr:polysaccharide pyruvyl transferase family protein [Ruminococcus sp.]
MKIGVITWWRNNYGSILQAYALQQALKELGYSDCEVISQYDKNPATVKNLFKKLGSLGLTSTIKIGFWKFGFSKMKNRTAAMMNFVNKHLQVSDVNYTEQTIQNANNIYDTFICGSDQIWNPTLTKLNSIYWLTFVKGEKRKIAYAPSIGVKSLIPEQKGIIQHNLSTFNAVSCREISGTRLLNGVLGNHKCKKVVDPTLLVKKQVWDMLSDTSKNEEKYIFVYFLRCGKEQRKIVEKFAQSKNLKIFSMPFLEPEFAEMYDLFFGDRKVWGASPADFITYIRNAEYVFTDSFHASVFSIIYHRDFYVFPKKGKAQMERLLSLFHENGIEDRIVNSIEEISTKKTIDWDMVDQMVDSHRKDSQNYLRTALEQDGEV